MEQEAFEQEKQRVEALFQRWIVPLYLGSWQFDRRYYQVGALFREETECGPNTAMKADVSWEYMFGRVSVNCEMTAHLSGKRLEEAVVHEMVHFHLAELATLLDDSDDVQKHVERVTTVLARCFVSVRTTEEETQ